MKYFQDLSSRTQVLVSTHNAIFASRPDIEVVYYIFKDEQGMTRIEQVNDLNISRLIEEMGIRPVDIFDFDSIAFVEGDDVKIFKAISKPLTKNVDTVVSFVDSG